MDEVPTVDLRRKIRMSELKPCPFCGVVPVLKCDLTDWKGVPVYKSNANGYRPITYQLKADHRYNCFIRRMDGLNSDGVMTSCSFENIIKAWNERKEE